MKIRERIAKAKKTVLNNDVAKKTIANSSWIVSDKIFTMLIGVFITAIIARYFGPEEYGRFNYALAFVSLFTALSTLGFETLTVKHILDKDYDESTILYTSFFLRILGGIILTISAFLIMLYIEPKDTNIHVLVLIMSCTMIFKAFEVIEYWVQAYQKAKISSVIRISSYVISAGLKLFLVLMGGDLVQFALIYLIDAFIIGLALIIAYFRIREIKTEWKLNFKYAKKILSQSWYLILSGLMVTLYMRIDQVMLGAMLQDKTEVGIYSAAVRIAEMWYFVPMAIITSFNPIIMGKKKSDEGSYLRIVQLLYTIVAWSGIVFGIIILIFSETIVGVLYGADYLRASSILSISVWAGTFAMLGSARSAWLISEGLQKYSVIYVSCGCITNVLFNYLLIPTLGGVGAAVATLFSQIVVVLIAPTFFKETRKSSKMILKAFVFQSENNLNKG